MDVPGKEPVKGDLTFEVHNGIDASQLFIVLQEIVRIKQEIREKCALPNITV
ncbi:hypothetical protein Mpsy_2221 [Methanolobus psychrophilus R15]|nr:hypothetical protein Mpsy_2221 [Methanolobus psychrophilus R15]